MEWHIYSCPLESCQHRSRCYIRCIWQLGVWSIQFWRMVSVAVGQFHDSSSYITVKELIPIVIPAMLWGHKWVGKTVRALCDNMAIVHVLHSRHSKDQEIVHLLQCLSLVECCYDFILVSKHLPGKLNILADALSRDIQFSKIMFSHILLPSLHLSPPIV